MASKRVIITPARVLVGVALLLTAALVLLPPMRSLAASFLGLFRVEKVQVITFDPGELGTLGDPGELGVFEFTPPSRIEQATLSEATEAIGFAVRLPSYLPASVQGEPTFSLMSTSEFTFIPDLAKIDAYLELTGAGDVHLPRALDGATIVGQFPAAVLVDYQYEYQDAEDSMLEGGPSGAADGDASTLGIGTLTVAQTRSPTLKIDRPGVDLEDLRQQILKMPMIPEDVKRQIEATGDWRRTLVIPLPEQMAHAESITVRGTEGIIVEDRSQTGATFLMWPENGMVFSLMASGDMSRDTLLKVAESLE